VALGNDKEEYKVLVVGMDSSDVAMITDVLSTAGELEGIAGLDLGAYALAFTEDEVNIASWIFSEYMVDQPDCYGADLLLGLDLRATMSATRRDDLGPARTVAIVNTALVSTTTCGPERTGGDDKQGDVQPVELVTRSADNVFVNAGELADRLLGNHQMSSFVLLGIAYQAGLVPVRAVSLEEALQQEAGDVTENLTAFKLGRFYHLHREELAQATDADQWSSKGPAAIALAQLHDQGVSAVQECAQILGEYGVEDEGLQLAFYPRVADLMLYQDRRSARQYARFVVNTMRREQECVPGRLGVTLAVARYLYKLIAYKDEYEVARLQLLEANRQRLASLFGDLSLCKVSYRLRLPWEKRITIVAGWWVEPALRVLATCKWVRRYTWNPFGWSSIRQLERNLAPWYQQVIETLLHDLHVDNYSLALSIAMAPEKIRGYGHIKEASIAAVKAGVEKALLLHKSRSPQGVMTLDNIVDLGMADLQASIPATDKTIRMYQQG
jgi:indolepyruvate ferredoxin oxidoreductase